MKQSTFKRTLIVAAISSVFATSAQAFEPSDPHDIFPDGVDNWEDASKAIEEVDTEIFRMNNNVQTALDRATSAQRQIISVTETQENIAKSVGLVESSLIEHEIKHDVQIKELDDQVKANDRDIENNVNAIRSNANTINEHSTLLTAQGNAISNVGTAVDANDKDIERINAQQVANVTNIKSIAEWGWARDTTLETHQTAIDQNAEDANTIKTVLDSVSRGQTANAQTIQANKNAQDQQNENIGSAIGNNANWIQNNTAAINTNTAGIQSNAGGIKSNTNQINDLGAHVSGNTGRIRANTATIMQQSETLIQHSGRINKNTELSEQAIRGVAISAAMNVILPDPGKKFRLNAAVASFSGTKAIGFTGAGRINDNLAAHFGIGFDTDREDKIAAGGVSYQW